MINDTIPPYNILKIEKNRYVAFPGINWPPIFLNYKMLYGRTVRNKMAVEVEIIPLDYFLIFIFTMYTKLQ